MNLINIKLFFKFILLINILFLFSCGGVKERVGLIKKAPDEFQVYEKKPLSVPPNFELRPPIDSDVVLDDSEDENVIFKEEVNLDESLTIADEVLLISLGDKDTDNNIRKVINDENSISKIKKPLLDKILDFDAVFEGEKKENTINAEEEKKRIQELKSDIKDIETNIEDYDQVEGTELNNNDLIEEEKSFLDAIFDFDLFGSKEENLEDVNQRDRTFFNKNKEKNRNKEESKIIDAVISEKEGSID